MLQLILGRSGAGKTTYLHAVLGDIARSGQRDAILLVPEQDSFAHERALLQLLGERDANRVEVLSFTRLSDALYRAFGGQSGRGLSDGQRAVTMRLALDAVRGKLNVFARAEERVVPGLLRLHRELSAAGNSPELMYQTSQRLGHPKLAELALILQAYDALLLARFGGAGDAMQSLCELLDTPQGRHFFAGKMVAVDAFWGFTAQELRVLGRIMEQAEVFCATLCLDELRGQAEDTGVFEHTQRTAAQLLALARQADVRVARPVLLPEDGMPPPRFADPALAALESAFLHITPIIYEKYTEAVRLCACGDREAECAVVAQRIKRLMRENNLRCKEIAVLARDTAAYERPLYAALQRVDLPVFADQRQPVASQPLLRFITAALEIAAEGFSQDAVLRWLKTGLAGLDDEEIAALENYALLWRIQGAAWLREWTAHPQGLGEAAENEISDLQLAYLNGLRRRVTAPLERFREAMRDCTGGGGAAALDALLQEVRVPAALKKLRADLEEAGRPAEAMELARVWDLCMGMLDELAQSLEDQAFGLRESPWAARVGAKRFAALFALALRFQTLGQLPQSLDAVTFGAADRARLQSPRAVFVLGMNDGIFPRVPGQEGLVSDRERKDLENAGFMMQDDAPKQLAMERLIAYQALTSARSFLHVSWALRTAAGEELRPSPWVRWLRDRFPAVPAEDAQLLPKEDRLEGESAGFTLLCEERAAGSPLYAALLAYYRDKPAYAPRLGALERAAGERPEDLRISSAASAALFRGGDHLSAAAYLSPTQVESYAQCPFRCLCQRGLKLRPRRPADFDPRLRGIVLHTVLEQIFRQHGVDALLAMEAAQRRALLDALMDDYAARYFPEENLAARVTFLYERLRGIAAQVLERMLEGFSGSRFRPVAYELRIDMDQSVKPYEVALPGGGALRLGGKADRVDCAEVNGQRYFRVVDYKSGGKEFSLGDVFDGLNLQMLVYLFALWQSGAPPYQGALPAGVLYEQVKDPVLTARERGAAPEETAQQRRESNRAAGFVLEDPDVLCAMEAGGLGVFVPARIGKSGLEQSVLSLARLGKLRRAADDVLRDTALKLQNGAFPASPLRSALRTPCGPCDFQAVCGHEPGRGERWERGLRFGDAVRMLDERYPDPGSEIPQI